MNNVTLNRVNNVVEVFVNNEYVGYCEKYGNKWGCANTEETVYSGGRSLDEVLEVLLEEVLV